MLVVTRRVGERVRVRFQGPTGPVDVWVMVVRDNDGGRLRLGFHGPDSVLIDREEVLASRADIHNPEKP